MAVGDELAGLAGRQREAQAEAHRVEPALELADHFFAGDALVVRVAFSK